METQFRWLYRAPLALTGLLAAVVFFTPSGVEWLFAALIGFAAGTVVEAALFAIAPDIHSKMELRGQDV